MQKGYIFQRGASWVVKFYETVMQDGQPVRRRVLKRLARVNDEFPTAQSVEHLAAEVMAAENMHARPESTETLAGFLRLVYLPACRESLRPSTVGGYEDMHKLVDAHLNGLKLRDTRTSDIDRILRDVAAVKPRARTTLLNARNFLSGAFRHAIRTDRFNRENPVREARIPKGKKPEKMPAYSLDEITAMLRALPEPARTVVATAAFSGLRHSEIRGLKWEDYTGEELRVSRSVWQSHEGEVKTSSSAAPVPVVPMLKKALDDHKKRTGRSTYIFEGQTFKPLVLANLVRREIKPALAKAGLQWRGWHAFRRGLASNLYRLGVPDMVIQRILRHSSVQVTQTHYVKTSDADTRKAMTALAAAFKKASK